LSAERPHPRGNRELFIDAFRGVMALLMVQGHTFDALLDPVSGEEPLYRFQQIFHGSTAPGFLFASGFVAGLPRAPLSARASVRRARRLLFVLGVGYVLNLPYVSWWKVRLAATPAERSAALACDALHVIALTQLAVLGLQWLLGSRWVPAAGILGGLVLALSPVVWSSGLSDRLPLALAACVDQSRAPSQFPVFPFSAFVLTGTAAGAALGRTEPRRRKGRAAAWGTGLLAAGALLSFPLAGRVDFWGPSPAYGLVRLGGLLWLLRLVEGACTSEAPGMRALALFGHETLLVYVAHLLLLFGGVLGPAPLGPLAGRLGFPGATAVFLAMTAGLLAAAWLWHRFKARAPHEGTLVLVFLGTAFAWEFLTRPW
jgi:uncharacterized membrane protein